VTVAGAASDARRGLAAAAGMSSAEGTSAEHAAPLRLEAHWDGRRVTAMTVANRRPQAARTLVGRSVDEALERVPALFGVCRRAQGLAATAACAAAGAGVTRLPDWAEERAIAAETAQEHLWRLLLDWPDLFGHATRRDRFANLYRRLDQLGDARAAFDLGGELLDLVAIELLGGFFRAIREPQGLAEFVERARSGGAIGETLADLIEMGSSTPLDEATPLLAARSAAAWAHELAGVPPEDFCRAPALGGRPQETGVLARHAESLLVRMLIGHGHRIAARLFARVIDLADCASRLRHPLAGDMSVLIDAAAAGDGVGIACVETARGLLIHAVRIDGARIADYAIVAPTEWNFHPGGVFAREAAGWQASSREAALLRLRALALSLDPCVAFDVVLRDAAADHGGHGADPRIG
jgi:coenzyme F420-reducing hydrogenase alpha subunit